MKKSIKQFFTRPMCLLLSLILLSGALTVAALTGSPYETLKKAAMDTVFAKSGTYKVTTEVYLDGVLQEQNGSMETHTQFSEDARLNFTDQNDFNYRGKKYSVSPVYWSEEDKEGKGWYSLYKYDGDDYYPTGPVASGLLSDMSRDSTYVRFAELYTDLMVGDLKNNLSISEQSGVKTVSGTLLASQIPELYNVGLSLMFASNQEYGIDSEEKTISETDSKRVYEQVELKGKIKTVRVWEVESFEVEDSYYTRDDFEDEFGYFDEDEYQRENKRHMITYTDYGKPKLISEKQEEATIEDYLGKDYDIEDIYDVPMDAVRIDFVSGTANIGKDGYLSTLKGNLRIVLTSVFGDTYEIEFKIDLICEDMGTTEVVCPIPGIDEVFTDELFQSFSPNYKDDDYYYFNLYFKLNADGTIDADSITKEYFSPTR